MKSTWQRSAVKQRRTKEVTNEGGKENGWVGSLLMWLIRHDLKCSVALCATNCCCCSGGNCGDAGALSGFESLELQSEGVSGRVVWRRKGCVWGVELSVYIVRRGIS